jgi:hypothetical protein
MHDVRFSIPSLGSCLHESSKLNAVVFREALQPKRKYDIKDELSLAAEPE